MAASRVPGLIDGLVSALTAALGSTVGYQGRTRAVIDGPVVEQNDARDVVYVGFGGDLSDLTSVVWSEEWRGLGAGRKQQSIDVRCSVVVAGGNDRIGELRAAAFATYTLVEAALRADVAVGLPSPSIGGVTGGTLIQEAGLRVRLPFTVNMLTRT